MCLVSTLPRCVQSTLQQGVLVASLNCHNNRNEVPGYKLETRLSTSLMNASAVIRAKVKNKHNCYDNHTHDKTLVVAA